MAINIKNLILTTIMVLNSNNITGAIGCMDDSYHTKQKNDPKTYHYVQCNCQCHKYKASFVRGKCPQCGHYHDPKDFNIVSYYELKKKLNLDNAAITKKAVEKIASEKNNQVTLLNPKLNKDLDIKK